MSAVEGINLACNIAIPNTKIKIHYASEWDPRQAALTKGGYLEGEITLPEYHGPLKMEIRTCPVEGPGMEEALAAGVHPTIVHNVRMGRGKREQEKEPVPMEYHWRQDYVIQMGKVEILNRLSHFDKDRNVPVRDVVTQVKDNKIILSRKCNNLNLIIVQPKQRCRADAVEATLTKVIANRLQETGQEVSDAAVSKLVKCFIGAKLNKNMKQIKLKVDFRDLFTNELVASCETVDPIYDYRNMHIGPLDLVDATPLKTCMEGGRKSVIVSEQTLPKDVQPIFQIWQGDIQRNDLEGYLNQPHDVQVRQNSIIFIAPPQYSLNGIDWTKFTLKLAVRRHSDKYISTKNFTFRYVPHRSQSCMYCSDTVNVDNDGKAGLADMTRTGKRALSMMNYKKYEVKQLDDPDTYNMTLEDLNLTIEDLSSASYTYSPLSSNVSIKEKVTLLVQPAPKKLRLSAPEEENIPTTVSEMTRSTVISTSQTKDGQFWYTASDIKEFDKYIDRLPTIFPLIKKDGEKQPVNKNDSCAKVEEVTVCGKKDLQEPFQDDSRDQSVNPLSYLHRFILFFFIFFFLQVLACLCAFDEDMEVPLMEFSSSSAAFSASSIFIESKM